MRTSNRARKRDNHKWAEMWNRIDYRRMPEHHKYDEEAGQDLVKFVESFGTYCKENFRGENKLWIGELEKHLSGKTLEAFKTVIDVEDTFRVAVGKLCDWYENSSDLRRKKYKKKFQATKFITGESLFFFCARLEKNYKLAYNKQPGQLQTSESLRDKFLESVPKSVRKLVNSQILSYKLEGKRITWKTFKEYCSHIDVIREQKSDNETDGEEIVINIGQGTEQRPVKKGVRGVEYEPRDMEMTRSGNSKGKSVSFHDSEYDGNQYWKDEAVYEGKKIIVRTDANIAIDMGIR
jgi:hypothetical protein